MLGAWNPWSARGAAVQRPRRGPAPALRADSLYQPTWITVANARLKGLWKGVPIFANDRAARS